MSEDNKKLEEEKKTEEETSKDKEKSEISESNKAIIEGFSKIADVLAKNTEVLSKMDVKLTKALEEPTDLPLKPKVQAEDDIGDKVKVPDTYQSNSQQASIDDSDPKNEHEKDPSDLKMQEKRNVEKRNVEKQYEQTQAPRPGAVEKNHPLEGGSGLTAIEKAYTGTDRNPVLDDLRKVGIESRNIVANKILKGEYFMPTEDMVGRY